MGGWTDSSDFPLVNPLQPALGGPGDAFVAKVSPDGSVLVFSTYLGGSGGEVAYGLAIDDETNIYLTGSTTSFRDDFPVVNALQPAYGGGSDDSFVAKVDSSGGFLIFATYWGGRDVEQGWGIAADADGNTYVAGLTGSADFRTFNAALPKSGGRLDAFVTKFNSVGSALIFSTVLGGSQNEQGLALALDPLGNASVGG